MGRWLLAVFEGFLFTCTLAQADGLKDIPLARPVLFGSALMGEPLARESDYRQTFLRNFNLMTLENELQFWFVRPSRERFQFEPAEAMVRFAQENRIPVRGHFLVPMVHLPDWLTQNSWSKMELEQFLVEHITHVIQHFRERFPGQIAHWDVANEIFTMFGNLKGDLFWSQIGNDPLDFMRIAYRAAHQADPQAKLFYNDVGNENFNLKSRGIFKVIRQLRAEGVPIHGIGIQAHLISHIDRQAMTEHLARWAAEGVEVQVTEMDVRVPRWFSLDEATYVRHAKIYGDLLKVCLDASNCTGLSVWGFSERHTWIPDRMPASEKGSRPSLLFDRDLQPRPAYHELIRVLRENRSP